MNEPQFCYVVVPGAALGERVGVVKRGEEGYYLTNFDSPKAADKSIRDFVLGMNARLGVDAAEARAMLYGIIFGWDDQTEKMFTGMCPGSPYLLLMAPHIFIEVTVAMLVLSLVAVAFLT